VVGGVKNTDRGDRRGSVRGRKRKCPSIVRGAAVVREGQGQWESDPTDKEKRVPGKVWTKTAIRASEGDGNG